MQIGITERGDAGLDYSWVDAVRNNEVNGCILITKCITDVFSKYVLDLYENGFKLIVHATTTGWGGTQIEPRVPSYKGQIAALKRMIGDGFPKENCVLRIDPIFPTSNGLKRVREVIEFAERSELMPIRIRVSVLDEYRHVKQRFISAGFQPIYGDTAFQANIQQLRNTADVLVGLSKQYGIKFECCAENALVAAVEQKSENVCVATGCISYRDLKIMGCEYPRMEENKQGRTGCHCLSCKKELLKSKSQCLNGCLYCYWKN